jgi:hypothetical protein
MSRRRALIVSGVVAFGLLGVLAALDARMHDAGGPGIIGFEVAGSQDAAREILSDWGRKGHDAARLSLWLDYPYLIANAIFLTLAVRAIRDGARRRGWATTAWAGGPIAALPSLAAGFDALEDVGLLLALGGHGGNAAPLLALLFASTKFLLTGIVVAYVLFAAVHRAVSR